MSLVTPLRWMSMPGSRLRRRLCWGRSVRPGVVCSKVRYVGVGNGLSDGISKLDLNSTQGNATVMVLLVVLPPVVQA